MKIEIYDDKYKSQIIKLILSIQNGENQLNLSLEEQPDLNDIQKCYIDDGGMFWVMLDGDKVIGTIGLMMKENQSAILKKFFVDKYYRSQGIGLELYKCLLRYAMQKNVKYIILDTPSVAEKSHKFYERAGFRVITEKELPVEYKYPDRNSLLYMLEIHNKAD